VRFLANAVNHAGREPAVETFAMFVDIGDKLPHIELDHLMWEDRGNFIAALIGRIAFCHNPSDTRRTRNGILADRDNNNMLIIGLSLLVVTEHDAEAAHIGNHCTTDTVAFTHTQTELRFLAFLKCGPGLLTRRCHRKGNYKATSTHTKRNRTPERAQVPRKCANKQQRNDHSGRLFSGTNRFVLSVI
jgi:hypothetical protein